MGGSDMGSGILFQYVAAVLLGTGILQVPYDLLADILDGAMMVLALLSLNLFHSGFLIRQLFSLTG